MANNVYIGNRYVPVFANPVEWDNVREYEPLTIVTYEGTAYTSKKTVPVGTALSNTEYWVVTGNYNAQVEQYRQEVVSLSNRVEILEDDIVITIGDSYLQGYTTGGNIDSWGDYLRGYLGMDTDHFKKFYQGGIGFGGGGYSTQAGNAVNAISTADRPKVKAVIVARSYNDSPYTMAQIQTGMNAVTSTLRNAFPNAKIYYIPVGWCVQELIANPTTTAYEAKTVTTLRWFNGAMVAGVYTAPNVYSVLYDNRCFTSDYVHPNAVGQQLIGQAIYQQVFGAGFVADLTFNFQALQNVSGADGTLDYSTQFSHSVKGDTTVLRFTDSTLHYTPSAAFDTGNVWGYAKKIGTYKDAGFACPGQGFSVPVNCWVQSSGQGYRDIPNACLLFRNGDIWVQFGTMMNDTHNGYMQFTGVSNIWVKSSMVQASFKNLGY